MFSASNLLFAVPDTVQTIEGEVWAVAEPAANSRDSPTSELLFTAGWLCPFLVHVWFPGNLFSLITHQETLRSSPSSCWFSSPVSQSRTRAGAGKSEWPKTHLLPCRTWHLCEKDGSEQCNCLPFPSNVSELFQWLCKECGGSMEAAVQLGCALVFCCQGEGGSLARF